jgi:hypothetical protein
MTTTSLEQTHVLLKVNVRLNILNTNEIIRQKEQSLVLKVPVEQLTNQATLDINLDDGVELANIDILEMDQELELAEIDIIKLDNDDSLSNKISEALSLNPNNSSQNIIENTQLIDKLANDWSEAQLKYQKEEEFKHEQERKLKELVEEIQEEEEEEEEEQQQQVEEETEEQNNIKPRLENNLKLEKILEEEEFTFNSSTEAEWEEEIEWEEEEAEWEDTNYDDSEEKPSESLEDSIQEIKQHNSTINQNQPIIISSSQENSLDYYDEEEEYFTDLDHDKNITNLSSSVDEWEDFSFNLGQLSQLSSATTTTTNTYTNTKNINRKNNSIEENIEDKRLLNLIENLFQLIDNDQNGMIDFNDIIRVVFILNYLLGRNYSQSDAIIFFNELDKDKDGRLNRNEFQNAFDFMFFS